MKPRQIFTTLTVLAGLFVILVNWQVCLPDGCFFNYQAQACQGGSCSNEDIGSHLQERLAFLTATINNNFLGSLFILIVVFFALLNDKKLLLICNDLFKITLKYFSLVRNPFDSLFAKGLLHPKIY
ncbi:MAG: hypothetical protein WC458_02305 [Patescibacteria group bacterium]